ncbi:MAG: DUF362 domain-containing protein [Calditrichaeota bacterium]|nr:MAG: DUF362 domain-containing protein [Calditrichota bacterium]
MHKSPVVLIRCESYELQAVSAAVERGLSLLGGIERYILPQEKILLKPNVLAGDQPERCISVHPSVFRAVAASVQAVTPHVTFGDSPGFGRPATHLNRAGMTAVAGELGIIQADFENGREVAAIGSQSTNKFVLANGVIESDGLISISKFKTHQLTRLTGAVKNQFGCIPGLRKAEYHVILPNAYEFANMLIALNLLIKPRLYIMDGIWAMQGNGPRGGDKIPMNVLLFSPDPIALDAMAARLIDLDPLILPTTKPGANWGLGVYTDEEIELLGDPPQQFYNKDFQVKRTPVEIVATLRGVSTLKNLISPRPFIQSLKCVKCGICVSACPVVPKALSWMDENKKMPPQYTYSRCIRCFCCQEMCPEGAIEIETPPLGRLFNRFCR